MYLIPTGASLVAQLVKNLPAVQETLVQFLGQEDPLEKGLATHSSILMAQMVKNPPAMQMTWAQPLGQEDSLEEGRATHSSILAGEAHEQRSLAGYTPWGEGGVTKSWILLSN